MGLGDFWEIRDRQTDQNKEILNVYHVKRVKVAADAAEVGQAFINWVLEDHLLALQPDTLERTSIEVVNLGDVTDFITIDSSTLPGSRSGQHFATFTGMTILWNRTRNDMKNGSKRYYAGVETDSTSGVWLSSFTTLFVSMASAMLNPWQTTAAPGIDVVQFCILKRFCVVPAQSPCLKYRMPITDEEIDDNHYVPATALIRAKQSSQVSRKIGN